MGDAEKFVLRLLRRDTTRAFHRSEILAAWGPSTAPHPAESQRQLLAALVSLVEAKRIRIAPVKNLDDEAYLYGPTVPTKVVIEGGTYFDQEWWDVSEDAPEGRDLSHTIEDMVEGAAPRKAGERYETWLRRLPKVRVTVEVLPVKEQA